jgi:hypothetical protein
MRINQFPIKKIITLISAILTISWSMCMDIAAQITVKTPGGTNVSYTTPVEIWSDDDKDSLSNKFANDYPNASEQGFRTSTSTYNCHSYAWHMTEGGQTCHIAIPSAYMTNDRYYTATLEKEASKIHYDSGNHSAVQTSTQGQYISKWGDKVLMRHARDYGASQYVMTDRDYYYFDMEISGSETILCSGTRTFSSNAAISGSTYQWIKPSCLTYVGTPASTCTVQRNGSGEASIKLIMTTPSGQVAMSSELEFWAGPPLISNKRVDGSSYYSGYPVCPGNHSLSISLTGEGAGTASWTVPSGISYFVGTNSLDFTFPSSSYGLGFSVSSTNTCGTASSSFYITKKTYGCSKGLSILLYPNPAISDYVSVSVVSQGENEMEGRLDVDNAVQNYTVKIYDNNSYLLSTLKRSGNIFDIPITNMKKGTYFIEVSDGVNFGIEQLMVNDE